MVSFPMKVRGLNVVLVVFSLLVLGGAAYYMSSNSSVNFNSGATNIIPSVFGKLVRKGTTAFNICKRFDTTYNYGILTSSSACTGLVAVAKMADPLVGQNVVAVGALKDGVMYATKITSAANCNEQCPGTDGVLRNCHPPENDGTSADSICNTRGRVEFCGSKNFCCPTAGGKWTTDMSKCPQPRTPTPSPKPTLKPTPTAIPTPIATIPATFPPTPTASAVPTSLPHATSCSTVDVNGGATYGGIVNGSSLYYIASGQTVNLHAITTPQNAYVNWKTPTFSMRLPNGGSFSTNGVATVNYTAPINTSGSDQGVDVRGDISEYPNPWIYCPPMTFAVHTQ